MFDISYCAIIFPELSKEIQFTGSFSISDSLYIWVNYDKSDKTSIALFSFIVKRRKFSIQIFPSGYCEITGFDCLCLTSFSKVTYLYSDHIFPQYKIEPTFPKEFLKIKCNLWVTNCLESSLNSKRWHSLSLHIPHSEPWFNSSTQSFDIKDNQNNITICFSNEKQQKWKRFPYTLATTRCCQVYLFSKDSLSTTEILEYATILQVLLRYMSDISYSLETIKISEEYESKKYEIEINGKFGLNGIAEGPSTSDYINIPQSLSDLNQNSLQKWINEWSKISSAITTVDLARAKPLNIQIVEYVKAFDTISSHFRIGSTSSQPETEFDNWKQQILNYIMSCNPFGYSKSRINGLLDNLNRDNLASRITCFLNSNKEEVKGIKETSDIPRISKYLKGMRNADAHPSDFDMLENIPENYDIVRICQIAKDMVRLLINKEIFKSD